MAVKIMPVSEVRQHLKSILGGLESTGEACFITQYGRPRAVLLRYADYNALVETPARHPYVGNDQGISGGEPIIRGTRISVRHIVQLMQCGMPVEEMLAAHAHLNAAQIHDALSYYYDHQADIDRLIEESRFERVVADQALSVEELANGIWQLRREREG